MLELRGIVPKHERPAPDAGPDGFSLVGRDGVRRATRIRATPEPRVLDDGSLVFDLDLEARGAIDLEVDFEVSESSRRRGLDRRAAQAPRGRHHRDLRRPALQPDPRAFAGRPRSAALRARRALLLRRRRAVVRHPVRSRQPDHLVPDAVVRARDRGGDAPAPGRAARAGVQRRARRGAGEGAPRAARGRAGESRRDPVRALLRLGGRHPAVPLPARPPRRLVRQPRPVPRAARARRGGARVDRPLRGSRRRRPRGVPAPLSARARDAGLEGLDGRHSRRRRRAAHRAGGARGGPGLRDPRKAPDGAHVRARRRRRARRAPARRGQRARGSRSSASGSPTRAATRSRSTATSAPGPGSPRTRATCSGPTA